MRPTLFLPIVLALAALGCAERALGPSDVAGSYGLVRYANDSLPWSYTSGSGCWARVEAGSLTLGSDGTFGLKVARTEACPNSGLVWVDIDASGTYGQVVGRWLSLRDANGSTYPAWLRGTHIVVAVPQVPLLGGGSVEVEFEAGAGGGGNGQIVGEGGTCCVLPPPPPDTSTAVIIIRRR